MEDPRIPVLLQLRKELEEELDRMRVRMMQLEAYIEVLDSMIGVSSFSTAETALGTAEPEPEPPEDIRTISITDRSRDHELATIEVIGQDITIIPAEHALYNIKRGAFARFFVETILGKYQQEDRRLVEEEELDWEEAFDFDVKAEDGILQEIIIRNYRDESRLEEIQRTLRWALEKIYTAR